MNLDLKLIDINDAHWSYDYDAGLTKYEKVSRLSDRLEHAGIDLDMIYFVAINTALPGQPENLYVRAVLRAPRESACDSASIGRDPVSA